jgi:putative peptidoglycan lipid II flippase
MSLFRNAAVQSSLTLASRVLGFARDLVLAAKIGAGPVGDAFYTALQFPNLFRRFFAEGAFAQAFVPTFARLEAGGSAESARALASQSLTLLTLITAAITILAQLLMPWIMLALFSVYRNTPEIFGLAILLTQITMPYLTFMSLAALFAGVLNARGRFALSAGAPTLLNLSLLTAALLADGAEQAAFYASVSVTIAGVLQAGLLWWGCRRLGLKVRFGLPRLSPDVKKVLSLALPIAFAASATQINILVSQALAGMEVGAKSWLNFADRLYQLPLGLVGVAVGVAILPRLSRAAGSGDGALASATLDDGLALAAAFTLPATAALMAMPLFLADGLFVRGAFTSADAAMTATALFHFAWGVPAFVAIKVLAPAYFAREQSVSPMRYALVSVILNIVLGAGLFFWLKGQGQPGFPGLAIATSTAAWANAILLYGGLIRLKYYAPTPALLSRLGRVGLSSVVLAAALFTASQYRVDLSGFLFGSKELAITLVCLGGAMLYAGLALLTGAVRLSELKAAFVRKA